MQDGRLSLARLCALQARHDKARERFRKGAVLEEQGVRPVPAENSTRVKCV
jgi:hypothetical protein